MVRDLSGAVVGGYSATGADSSYGISNSQAKTGVISMIAVLGRLKQKDS